MMHSACIPAMVENFYQFGEDWSSGSSVMVVFVSRLAGIVEEAVDEGLEALMSGVVYGGSLFSYSS